MSSRERDRNPCAVIKRERVRLEKSLPGSVSRPAAGARTPCDGAPSVRLIRSGDRVQALEFTCRCGEVSVLELQYEESP